MNYYPLNLSPAGLEFIKKAEFFVGHAYQDSAGIWTIGYGSTMYKDGTKPKPGDTITEPDATDLLLWAVNSKAKAVAALIRNPLNQNQQDAVISLIYNIGVGAFTKSTVLRMINQNQDDPDIRTAWMLWNKSTVKGVLTVLPGLTNRRKAECDIYFQPM